MRHYFNPNPLTHKPQHQQEEAEMRFHSIEWVDVDSAVLLVTSTTALVFNSIKMNHNKFNHNHLSWLLGSVDGIVHCFKCDDWQVQLRCAQACRNAITMVRCWQWSLNEFALKHTKAHTELDNIKLCVLSKAIVIFGHFFLAKITYKAMKRALENWQAWVCDSAIR